MTFYNFTYTCKLIVVDALLYSDVRPPFDAKLVLDTGSTRTIIKPETLSLLGCDTTVKADLTITSASKNDKAISYELLKITSIGFEVENLKIAGKSFPASFFFIDGLLGLDFFQAIKKKLIIDFENNQLAIV